MQASRNVHVTHRSRAAELEPWVLRLNGLVDHHLSMIEIGIFVDKVKGKDRLHLIVRYLVEEDFHFLFTLGQ